MSLAIFVVLGRLLEPQMFGVVATAMVFVYLINNSLLSAIGASLVALSSPQAEDYDTGFWILAGTSLGCGLLLCAAARPFALLYHVAEFEPVLRAVSVIVVAFGLSYAHGAWARKNFRFRELTIRNVIGTVAGGAVGIVLAIRGHGITALVASQIATTLTAQGLLWVFVPWRPRLRFSCARARTLLEIAIPQAAAQALQFGVQNLDTVLVTYVLGPLAGGLYAAAKRITLALQQLVWAPIAGVVLPTLSEVADDNARLGRIAVRTATVVMAITAPVFFAVGASSHALIEALFGSRWLGAAPVLTILSLLGITVPSMGVLHVLLLAQRRTKVILYFASFQTLVAVFGIAAFGRENVESIAFCLMLPAVFAYAGTYLYVRRSVRGPMKGYLRSVARPVAAAALMAGSMMLVPDLGLPPFAQLTVLLSVGAVVYALALFFVARDTLADLLGLVTPLLPSPSR